MADFLKQFTEAAAKRDKKKLAQIYQAAISSAITSATNEIAIWQQDFYKIHDSNGDWKKAEKQAIRNYLDRGAMNKPGEINANKKTISGLEVPKDLEYRPIGYKVKTDLAIFSLRKDEFPGVTLIDFGAAAFIPTGHTTVSAHYEIWAKFAIECEGYLNSESTRKESKWTPYNWAVKSMEKALEEVFPINTKLGDWILGTDSKRNQKIIDGLMGRGSLDDVLTVEALEALTGNTVEKVSEAIVDAGKATSGDSTDELLAQMYYGISESRSFETPWFHDSILGKRPDDPHFLRIGDYITSIPPESISITRVNANRSTQGIRQSNSVPESSGYEQKLIRIPIYINGMQAINGKAVEAPTGGFYYLDGLRSLLAQFKRTPFLPIENEHINNLFGIYAIALSSINIQTVPGFPESLMVELTMFEFDSEGYTTIPSYCFDAMFDWDLFRWYYQGLLGDEFGKLKKINGKHTTGEFKLDVIKTDALMGITDSAKGSTFNIYDMSNYIEYDFNDYPISITSVTGGYQNVLPKTQLTGAPMPNYQYLGCTDGKLTMVIETESREFCAKLNEINTYLNSMARNFQHMHGVGFCVIKNDIANLMGMSHCVIDAIDISTVVDFPGLYRITIDMTSYDGSDKYKDGIMGFNPFNIPGVSSNTFDDLSVTATKDVLEFLATQTLTMNTAGLETKIKQDAFVEKVMSSVNHYPDLNLPTFGQVDAAIESINTWRKKVGAPALPYEKYPRDISKFDISMYESYVDPDFYIMYAVNWGAINGSDLDGNFISKELLNQDPKLKTEFIGGTLGRTGDGIGTKTVTKKTYSRKVLLKEYLGQPAVDYIPKNEKNYNQFIRQDENLERSFVDMLTFNKRGRLLRAFPTYMFMVIDDGGNLIDGRRLWSNYYIVQSLMSLSTHASRENGMVTLNAAIKNTYGTLSKSEYQINWVKRASSFFQKHFGTWFGTPKVTAEALINKLQIFKSVDLREGCRLHVRMGYGNNAELMPIVFNGVVTEISGGEVLNIVAQSDALELHNGLIEAGSKGSKNGIFNLGNEPSDIIKNILQNRQSWLSHLNIFGADLHDCFEANKYGLEHFGMYLYGKDGSWVPDSINSITGNAKIEDKRDSSKTAFTESFKNQSYWSKNESEPDFAHDFNDYDLVKNIYIADPKMNPSFSHLHKDSVTNWNGEYDAQFGLFGKSAWDAMQVCANICPEYVCQPVFHQFESRIFFGHPTFLYKYKWTYEEVGGRTVIREKAKTFTQIHSITSRHDILDNGITATSYNVPTNVNATYKKNNSKVTNTLYADRFINSEYQKNVIVATDIQLSMFNGITQGTLSLVGLSDENAKSQATRVGTSALIEMNKKRYTGQLLVVGDSAIKPCDMINLFDDVNKMNGLCGVREVAHIFASDTGFVTEITPDMVVFNNVDGRSALLDFATKVSIGTASLALVATIQTIGAKVLLSKGVSAAKWVGKTKTGVNALNTYRKTIAAGKTVTWLKAASIGAVGTFSLVGLAIWVGTQMLIETVLSSIVAYFKYQNCIKLFPLTYNGRPYVTGIKGQQRLLFGADETYEDSLKSWDERVKALEKGLEGLNDSTGSIAGEKSEIGGIEYPKTYDMWNIN